jgi:glutathione synthase/RimK-type ligase-like ATP-grasp enzyme
MISMVERAHALFPDRIMLGFDVAITDRGPVIIEGNVQSGCDMVQRTHDLPVGRQRLGAILAYHMLQARNTRLPRHMHWFGPLQYWRRR